MKILQRNLNRSTFVVWEMKRNVSVVCVKFRCNILISGKIIKEMPGSVASGTFCTYKMYRGDINTTDKQWRRRTRLQNGTFETATAVSEMWFNIRSNEMQQYAGVYLLQNYSTSFGCLSHPSSVIVSEQQPSASVA